MILHDSSALPPAVCGSPADVVQLAQARNLQSAGAKDWWIDAQGRVCLSNVLDLSFDQGVMSYAYPERYDKKDPKCNPKNLGIKSAQVAAALKPGANASEPFVFDAIPIPGRQKVTVPCRDFATCGME